MEEHQSEPEVRKAPVLKPSFIPYQKFIAVGIGIILAVVLVVAIKSLGPILKPLLIAVFFCLLVAPVERLLVKIKIPRPVAYLVIFCVVITAGFFIGKLISLNARAFTEKLPVYQETIRGQIERFDESVQGMKIVQELGLGEEFDLSELASSAYLSMDRIKGFAAKSIGSFFTLVGNTLVVLLLMVFILLEADNFPARVVYAYGEARAKKILDVARTIARDVVKYLAIKTVIAGVTGVIFAVLLGVCGVEFYILWGVSAFVFHFIPYIGSYLALVLPVLMVLIQFSPKAALLMLGVLGTIQLLLGSYMEPRVIGRELKLSPLVILLSLAFWGWVWGIVGVFLAVPITATLKIVMENFSGTHNIARLMSHVTESTLKTKKERAGR